MARRALVLTALAVTLHGCGAQELTLLDDSVRAGAAQDLVAARRALQSNAAQRQNGGSEQCAVDLADATAAPAAFPLATPIPYSGDELVHPDVYFNDTGWNGYRYWMAVTPYESTDPRYENPSIYGSNDGQTWVTPPGVTNPLVPYPGVGRYNSDPDLVDSLDGYLYLFYREVEGGVGDGIFYIRSNDGSTWSAPVLCLKPAASEERPVSPAVIFDGKTWAMFYVDVLTKTIRRRTADSAGGPWSLPVTVRIAKAPTGMEYWHLDAVNYGRRTILLVNVALENQYGGGGVLYVAWSDDGTNFTLAPHPILVSGTSWETKIYRSSFVPMRQANRTTFAIWYSATDTRFQWRLGYTEAYFCPRARVSLH